MADVAATLSQWSTTASSNAPADSTSVGSGLGDNLRTIQSVIATYLAAYNAVAIASSGTCQIGGVAGLFLEISGNTTITAFGTPNTGSPWKIVRFQDALTLTHNAVSLILPGGANITTVAGDYMLAYHRGSGNWTVPFYQRGNHLSPADNEFRVVGSADITKRLAFEVDGITTGQTRTVSIPDYDARIANIPSGIVMDYGGSVTPSGWLDCDGAAVSRTTYASLFTAIGTAWGVGDGVNTFNVPDLRGRVTIGDGTGTLTASGVNADVDVGNGTLAVANNFDTWISGMIVVFTLSSGTITGLVSGNTYYIIRSSATTVRMASTLENAQNGTAITLSGKSSPVWTITHTLSVRTIGVRGGEQAHAQSSTELLKHLHSVAVVNNLFGAGGNNAATTAGFTGEAGDNAFMNIMQPYGVLRKIIAI